MILKAIRFHLGGLFVLLILGGAFSYLFSQYKDVKHWPSVDGIILSCRGQLSNSGPNQKLRSSGFSRYFMTVEFNYVVNGKKYKNIGTMSFPVPTTLEAQKYIQDTVSPVYEIGKSIPVYYSPLNPKYSTIIRGYSLDYIPNFIILIVFLFLSVLVNMIIVIRKRKRK